MSITHEEARRLIQFNADEALNGPEKNLLEAHLESCRECRSYAKSIQDMELVLQPMLQKRWNNSALPLPKDRVVSQSNSTIIRNLILATRIAAVGAICIAFLFNIWQFTRSTGQLPILPSAISLPAPTPSLLSTSTKISELSCAHLLYVVQEGDTLESIANQFAVNREEIVRENNIGGDSIKASMKLVIPTCSPTPSGSLDTATTAFTPRSNPMTSTPMGNPTQ